MATASVTTVDSCHAHATTQRSGQWWLVRFRSASVFAYAVPTLLCVVAVFQRYLVVYHNLDIWKGGGFGMFSAISAQNLRQMTVTLILADGSEKRFPPTSIASRIPLDGDMARIRRRIITMPHRVLLEGLADRLAAAEWVAIPIDSPSRSAVPADDSLGESFVPTHSGVVRDDPPAGVTSDEGMPPEPVEEYYRMQQDAPKDATTRPLALSGVRVEVWQYVLDRKEQQLKLTKLAMAYTEATR